MARGNVLEKGRLESAVGTRGGPAGGAGGARRRGELQAAADSVATLGTTRAAFPGIADWHHYLIVDYCKVNALITNLSIDAHGCDTSGFVFCNLGPAWISREASGPAGRTWTDAYYGTTINRLTGLSYTSDANVWIWLG